MNDGHVIMISNVRFNYMKSRKFFLIALISVILGLTAHIVALKFATRAGYLMASSLVDSKASPDYQKYAGDTRVALFLGFACAAIGTICLLVSYRLDEPASRSLVVLLLVFYVILQFGAV
jgi:DMSO reductase anchor subunit